MTTNHRPTLESKRGKRQAIGDTIAHARALPQQTSLKTRKKLPSKLTDAAVNQLKQELLEAEGRAHTPTTVEGDEPKAYSATEESEAEKAGENDAEGSASDDSEHSEYSSDSDVDTEELLKELAQIRQEKEHQSQNAAANAIKNPVKSGSSWRKSTPFNAKNTSSNEPDEFTTDALNSDYHKSFLSKYIR